MNIPWSSDPISAKFNTYNVSHNQDMISALKCVKSFHHKSITDDHEESRSSNFPLANPYIAAYLIVVGKLSLHYFFIFLD